jgi:hypothetical protein
MHTLSVKSINNFRITIDTCSAHNQPDLANKTLINQQLNFKD